MDVPARRLNPSTTDAPWHNFPPRWAAWFSACLVLLLLGSASLLILRRGAGALARPLTTPWLLLVGLCVASLVIASRRMVGKQASRDVPNWLRRTIDWGPTLAVAMFAIALSIEGTSLIALTGYLILIVGAEFLAARDSWPAFRFGARAFPPHSAQSPQTTSLQTTSLQTTSPQTTRAPTVQPTRDQPSSRVGGPLPREDEEEELDAEALETPVDENIWQQMSRLRTATGEVITGWVKSEFQPGERTAVLHVAFCPPLRQTPTVQIEQLSGPPARIKVGQVLPQGARFEIRLNTPGVEAETLLVEFVALEHEAEA